MASSIFPFLPLLLLAIWCGYAQSHEDGHIAAEISNKGLDFLKGLLIEKAESSLVPLELPVIEKTVKIPVLGKVQMVLSDITIEKIHTTSSVVKTGDSGIVIEVSGATANLSMNWKYSYTSTWLIPISVSDKGNATVQVTFLHPILLGRLGAIGFRGSVVCINRKTAIFLCILLWKWKKVD
ncbi:lipid-binding serum glycoprotein family protein [Striga asiatica]|uniref:Lipid-binding serum glycoprotein family protein n=1 Tax=Striga asiatica TaxID=4170 RepID=A0A5A7RKI3_STRAF|nr:lipid-binding serum glycoprotein family protein [Striga asiatica]